LRGNNFIQFPTILRELTIDDLNCDEHIEDEEEDINSNCHQLLSLIDECNIPEGKYLEMCNLLRKMHTVEC
jgi:hypothetical protein